MFLLDHSSDLFTTPMELLDLVSTKLRSLQNGGDPDDFSGFTFCQRLSVRAYEEQRYHYTRKEVQQLIKMLDSIAIPEKKRKKLLKEFQKCHPSSSSN